jgi:hypothetical protein
MNMPNNSSNALRAREANGLVEGNGTSADNGSEDDSFFIFLSDALRVSIGFRDSTALVTL